MKNLLILIALVFPAFSFAGPEDHTPGAIYTTKEKVPYYLMALVFDTAKISEDGKNLVLQARYGNFFGEFPIIQVSRHNEDKINYVARKVIIDRSEAGCGSAEKAVATVKAQEFASIGVSPTGLEITIEYTTINDICHSRPQTRTLQYELAQ